LRERGLITDSPKDIGLLIKEVQQDIEKECIDDIKERLYKHAITGIRRAITGGLPEWYKEELMKLQFIDVDSLNVPDNTLSSLPDGFTDKEDYETE
jgi:hypothetical protein